MKHLLSIDDLDREEITSLVAHTLAAKAHARDWADALDRRTVLLLLAKPSMRTRISVEVAMRELGGHAIAYPLDASTIGKKETFGDFARTASRYVAAILARLYDHHDLEEMARHASVPVVNALTDLEHPLQTIADLATIEERRGLEGARVAFVGDAHNNVTHSLLLACAKIGAHLAIASPATMRPDARVLARAQSLASETGARLLVTDDPVRAVDDADAVYTDTWMSYHVPETEAGKRRRALEPYRVTRELMASAPRAIFLHCLPATRGDEVASEVLDSDASAVFDQAENRLHATKAVLVFLLRPGLFRALPAALSISRTRIDRSA